ncbi:MAG: MIP/aquaporin family protein [Cytophagales bacterium]|nr:MIP/aquaporin family protein [Cytophagales bacterium]
MTPFAAELLGSFLLILFGNGVVANVVLARTKSQSSGWIVITLAWGLAVAMSVYVVGRISGGHLNPAVTLALASVGAFSATEVPTYLLAQLVGAFLGAVTVFAYFRPHFAATASKENKLAVFATSPAIEKPLNNLFSEIISTFVLVLGMMGIGNNQLAEGLNPLLVGLLVVLIGLTLGGTTGYAINPARDLAPRLAHFLLPVPEKGSSHWQYAWIPVVGPIVGGVAAAQFFDVLIKGNSTSMWFYLTNIPILGLWLWNILRG